MEGCIKSLDEAINLCQQARQLANDALRRIQEEKEEQRKSEQQKIGKFSAVKIDSNSELYNTARNEFTIKQLKGRNSIYKCSGADADGICRHGREFRPTWRKSDVDTHIKTVHQVTGEDRLAKEYGLTKDGRWDGRRVPNPKTAASTKQTARPKKQQTASPKKAKSKKNS